MTGTALKPLPGAITERPAPTLSETLHKFIQERGVPGDLTVFANGAKAIVDIRKLWLEFDRSAETQAAGRVLQGFCLAWIRYTSPGEFVSGLAERGMPVRSAYDLMEDFEAFNRLPNLKQIGRLSEIGSSKTRMLAKALGDDLPKFLDGKSTFYGLVPDEVEAASVVDLIKHQPLSRLGE